ncbi:MAG: Vacuolar fusion protein mon1 [Pycnora praestabilis]|nr:MAG: Vacuolar fusion protein mon1 [Pycnora praestabilis]
MGETIADREVTDPVESDVTDSPLTKQHPPLAITLNAPSSDDLDNNSGCPTESAPSRDLGKDDVGDEDSALVAKGAGSEEEPPPPLPPRPKRSQPPNDLLSSPLNTLQRARKAGRPKLQSQATTALSLTDIHTQSRYDGSRETYSTPPSHTSSGQSARDYARSSRRPSRTGSDADDKGSVRSFAPTLEAGGDVESLLGEIIGDEQQSPAWKILGKEDGLNPFEMITYEEEDIGLDFRQEFDDIGEVDREGDNEEALLGLWRSKMKHFLILSSAGKPIYTRHGDPNLISGYIGVIQTIISFYHEGSDPLKSFTAGGVRFVIMSEGPLYLVAISRLGESDSQLRVQLEALYMQILSTLTLPNLMHIFSARPSSDLRRPLQGTEPLLSALADTFTRGSPPTLLSALECLKLRSSQRQLINDTLLGARSQSLLYGLIVAGGRLVSVVRPKKHSLHPSDLQLIFNMLFEAEGVKAGGGENWIPLCLPGFNKKGYLYMYVSFLSARKGDDEDPDRPGKASGKDDEVAVILISANKESFYEMRQMQDDVVHKLENNGSMGVIKTSVQRGRPKATDIVPGTVLRHFLYKSRGNVQFTMPSFEPYFDTLLGRRRLLSMYHTLHASVHAKNAHLKVHHCVSQDSISLAWVTPLFELYCVAGPRTSRNALAQGANRVVQWVRREEERVFIIGGAVF